jgi:hypothetical protein
VLRGGLFECRVHAVQVEILEAARFHENEPPEQLVHGDDLFIAWDYQNDGDMECVLGASDEMFIQ